MSRFEAPLFARYRSMCRAAIVPKEYPRLSLDDEIAAVTKVKREDDEEDEIQYDEEGNPIVVEPVETGETAGEETPDHPAEPDVE